MTEKSDFQPRLVVFLKCKMGKHSECVQRSQTLGKPDPMGIAEICKCWCHV